MRYLPQRRGPRPSRELETTIDTRLQEAAVVGLAGRLGGVAALAPRNREMRGLAGDRRLTAAIRITYCKGTSTPCR